MKCKKNVKTNILTPKALSSETFSDFYISKMSIAIFSFKLKLKFAHKHMSPKPNTELQLKLLKFIIDNN